MQCAECSRRRRMAFRKARMKRWLSEDWTGKMRRLEAEEKTAHATMFGTFRGNGLL